MAAILSRAQSVSKIVIANLDNLLQHARYKDAYTE